jgi:hypothetical protein
MRKILHSWLRIQIECRLQRTTIVWMVRLESPGTRQSCRLQGRRTPRYLSCEGLDLQNAEYDQSSDSREIQANQVGDIDEGLPLFVQGAPLGLRQFVRHSVNAARLDFIGVSSVFFPLSDQPTRRNGRFLCSSIGNPDVPARAEMATPVLEPGSSQRLPDDRDQSDHAEYTSAQLRVPLCGLSVSFLIESRHSGFSTITLPEFSQYCRSPIAPSRFCPLMLCLLSACFSSTLRLRSHILGCPSHPFL